MYEESHLQKLAGSENVACSQQASVARRHVCQLGSRSAAAFPNKTRDRMRSRNQIRTRLTRTHVKGEGEIQRDGVWLVGRGLQGALYFFERKHVNGKVKVAKLTTNLYLEIVTKHFLPHRLATMSLFDKTMYLASDNDIKHVSILNRAALDVAPKSSGSSRQG